MIIKTVGDLKKAMASEDLKDENPVRVVFTDSNNDDCTMDCDIDDSGLDGGDVFTLWVTPE